MIKVMKPAFVSFLFLTVLCGVIYTGLVTGIAQVLFPNQANGSMITTTNEDGKEELLGSALLAQPFTEKKYLIGRPLGMSNFSPVSTEQAALVKERILWWRSFDPNNKSDIPNDLITASGSGIDPNISPEAADFQVKRIAAARKISESDVKSIIKKYTTGRFSGFWGEPRVNVLKVNLALDKLL